MGALLKDPSPVRDRSRDKPAVPVHGRYTDIHAA